MTLPKVYVITATIGTSDLITCIKSVQGQTYENIEHVLVCDGSEFEEKITGMIQKYKTVHPITKVVLPWNSGRNKYICHKIYASIPHLLHDPCLVTYLDEDNYIESNHISSMVETLLENKYSWVYCLRNIVGARNNLICRDICESLGKLSPTWVSLFQKGSHDFLVDTSCYLVPVHILRKYSECWQRQARTTPEADRFFYSCISKDYPNYGCTMKYTLNYKIENRSDSVKADFFAMGNGFMRRHFQSNVPWDI